VLTVEHLRAGYGAVEVLRGVSIRVDPGEVVALLGPNGAGKSTLLRTLSGTVAATSGSITFDGRSIVGIEAHARPHLGLVQVPEARHVFGELTVRQNLLVGATALRDRSTRFEMLEEIWELFPALKKKGSAAAGSLSGGQQQMLAIGRALMSRPKLLMLDEPSLGLAPKIVDEVYDALVRLLPTGLTVLIVEQDVYAALDFAARAYVLENGQIVLTGGAAELRESAHVREAYLGI
jgi:branched-chain amino acid transport system ATP-binding protein